MYLDGLGAVLDELLLSALGDDGGHVEATVLEICCERTSHSDERRALYENARGLVSYTIFTQQKRKALGHGINIQGASGSQLSTTLPYIASPFQKRRSMSNSETMGRSSSGPPNRMGSMKVSARIRGKKVVGGGQTKYNP